MDLYRCIVVVERENQLHLRCASAYSARNLPVSVCAEPIEANMPTANITLSKQLNFKEIISSLIKAMRERDFYLFA